MRKVFTALAALLLVAIVVQFFLAAGGAFDTASTEEAFQPHRALGNGIFALAILVTIAAAIARVPGRLMGLSGLVAALILVQSLIREVAKSLGDDASTGHLVFGLHGVNGLLILGVTGMILLRTRQLAVKPAAEVEQPAS
jgi:cytochrome b561